MATLWVILIYLGGLLAFAMGSKIFLLVGQKTPLENCLYRPVEENIKVRTKYFLKKTNKVKI